MSSSRASKYEEHTEKNFSQWLTDRLPPSTTGFCVQNVDFVLYNHITKKVALVELKTHHASMSWGQHKFYEHMDRWMRNGMDEGWEYVGFYLIQFTGTCFHDGECKINGREKTEAEAIHMLSNFLRDE